MLPLSSSLTTASTLLTAFGGGANAVAATPGKLASPLAVQVADLGRQWVPRNT